MSSNDIRSPRRWTRSTRDALLAVLVAAAAVALFWRQPWLSPALGIALGFGLASLQGRTERPVA